MQKASIKLKQKGAALIIFAVIFALVATSFLLSRLNAENIKIEREKKTAIALAKAKVALIGWSISRRDAGFGRPGELPCPDTDAPNTLNYGIKEANCVAGKIGRFPWRSLGTEELKDGYGESLWYAIDGAFRERASLILPINSNSRASMRVYAEDGLTLITPAGEEVAAMLIAPGHSLNGQSRSANLSACPATGTNILENRCATNYLEFLNGRNNATNNGPFIRGKNTNFFNDTLVFITASKLISATENRVARELKIILQSYKIANGYYPYPAKFDATGCRDVHSNASVSDCESDTNICRGRFPDKALPIDWTAGFVLPNWFEYNLWGQTIYYSVGTDSLATAPLSCSSKLTVNSTSQNGIFIMAGTPKGSIKRSDAAVLPVILESLDLSLYLEDAENQDGWNTPANDVYITPTNISDDNLYVLP